MSMPMELVIKYNGKDWVVENELMTVSAATLEELDIEVGRLMRQKGLVGKGEKKEVYMFCNNSIMIPEWMRPYAQHYFNRILEVEG